jgi:hypothetical protein
MFRSQKNITPMGFDFGLFISTTNVGLPWSPKNSNRKTIHLATGVTGNNIMVEHH